MAAWANKALFCKGANIGPRIRSDISTLPIIHPQI
jgi:hypothetical protein